MKASIIPTETTPAKTIVTGTVYSILFTISFTHLLNDMMQSVIPAVYPLIKTNFNLSFTQIGLITLTFQLTASLLQPFIGFYTDKKPMPNSLAIGMGFTLIGLICISLATSFLTILISVSLIGMGSSVFHPESSRVAYLASGGKKGLAQSIFQLGGNAGSAIGPLLAALIIMPYGQFYIIWFAVAAVAAIVILSRIGKWYGEHMLLRTQNQVKAVNDEQPVFSRKRVIYSIVILLVLIFSKYFYMASMTSYFTFYLIDKFHVTVEQSQMYLFAFLAAVAAGTVIGGPLGDRFGRKYIIWISILGAAPFTLLLPHADLAWTVVLAVLIGVIISSAFSAILVYATDLVPGKVGMIAGLFFGFAFGMGGLGSAVLGWLADKTSIEYIFQICAFLPLIGIITIFLPNIEQKKVV
ncbi:Fosmidomycin resistance protein [Pedobacter antarcticus 4BY]|uniref:Fosmidomycin resistance protein n=2 Tax=Pedobacter antarcticus TaxID=34086 RepID=A0A081PCR8_9SPHI|nr:MFS transporter [Pedobacter antarcticus]KEQ28491.1 Fosmidomycin resistance protein [Pedobacter antarcticus 4BY]SFF02745.1 MFS transporter, FSR family, fosmidomycin resistance protein [Pedobacter antarcticus]